MKGNPEVKSGRKALNDKVKLHYKRTLRPLALCGLWRWRTIALALQGAALPLHTGTVCVERFWSVFASMLPRATTTFTERWYKVIADLSFLRYNRAHYGACSREGWAHRDSLLMQQLPILENALAALQTDPSEGGHLQPLYKVFLEYLQNKGPEDTNNED